MQRFKILILFAFISFGFINSYSSDTQVKIGDKVYTIIEKNALDSLEAHNQTLQVKIDSTNNRINDFFIWIPSMVVLIIVLLGVNFFGG
ncbi:MAG: hypothetical protein HZB41_12965 [Ignavibacteriae bacterium]|nr:hypothetical protein [Ignavibacteriota bacterium]